MAGRWEGEELHICTIYGDVPPKLVDFTHTYTHKARVPLHSSVPAKITLWKRCPFPTLFFSFVGCEILITIITMHSINWWNQNYLCAPTTRSEGEEIHIGLYKMGWAAQKICRVPLHSSVPAKITLSKRCPFPTLVFIVWLQNSQNDFDAIQNWWNQNYLGAPSIRAKGELHITVICIIVR